MQKPRGLAGKPDDSTGNEIKDVKKYYSGKERPLKFYSADDILKYLDD